MSEKQYSMLRAGKLEKNDILYCIRGSLGKCGIFQMEQGAIASSLVIVRPYFKTLSTIKYLLSYLTSDFIRTEIYKYDNGTAQPNLAANDFSQFLIPLPPLSEQQRISETVETLLQLVETIDSDKIDLSNLIKQTKAKVLDLAIKGKLVPQDPNDEPAGKLLEKIREEKEKLIKEGKLKRDKNETYIFKNSDDNSYYEQIDGETICIDDDLPFEIPDSWRWERINNYTKTISAGGDKPSIVSPVETEICQVPIFSNGLTNNGLYGYTNVATIAEPSITISARGTIGYNCIRIIPYYPIVRLISIIPFSNLSNIKYLSYILTYLFPIGSGSSIPQLTVPEVSPILIPIPPAVEQNKIAEKIENIFTYLDNLESIIKGS